jgi:hypothetical protein
MEGNLTAKLVTWLTAPPIIVCLTLAFLAFYAPQGTGLLSRGLAFSIAVGILLIAPLLEAYAQVREKKLSWDMPTRKERTAFYQIWMKYSLISIALFFLLECDLLLAFSLVFAETNALLWLVNKYYTKLSMHASASTGLTSSVILLLGFDWLWVYGLVAIVSWSRLALKAHDFKQVVLGAGASWLACYFTYPIFYNVFSLF